MHCWKTVNIKKEYGPTWLSLMELFIFILVFSFSFLVFGRLHPKLYDDQYFFLFALIVLLLYPIHKLIHYYSLFKFRKSVKLKLRFEYMFIPIIKMRIQTIIPKKRYIFTLVAPFIIINGIFILLAISYEQYVHYISLLIAYHCSMCFIDFLFIFNLIKAPKNAVIEETPKGCEILIPTV